MQWEPNISDWRFPPIKKGARRRRNIDRACSEFNLVRNQAALSPFAASEAIDNHTVLVSGIYTVEAGWVISPSSQSTSLDGELAESLYRSNFRANEPGEAWEGGVPACIEDPVEAIGGVIPWPMTISSSLRRRAKTSSSTLADA